jgi:hypothetical protein
LHIRVSISLTDRGVLPRSLGNLEYQPGEKQNCARNGGFSLTG